MAARTPRKPALPRATWLVAAALALATLALVLLLRSAPPGDDEIDAESREKLLEVLREEPAP